MRITIASDLLFDSVLHPELCEETVERKNSGKLPSEPEKTAIFLGQLGFERTGKRGQQSISQGYLQRKKKRNKFIKRQIFIQ